MLLKSESLGLYLHSMDIAPEVDTWLPTILNDSCGKKAFRLAQLKSLLLFNILNSQESLVIFVLFTPE